MTSILLKDAVTQVLPKCLPSKEVFDSVGVTEMIKPEIGVSGSINSRDSVQEISASGKLDTPIIAPVPNFYKERGTSVSDEGFVKLPRSLLNDPQWQSLKLKQRHVFQTILSNACYTERKFSIAGNVILVRPGQLCIALRALVELCNKNVRFKEDKVDLPFVQRSVSFFTKVEFVRQEVIHGKSLLTICHRELYEHFQSQSDTGTDTNSIHDRYTNEERKERKDMKETIDRADAPDRSSLFNIEFEEEKKPSIFDAPTPPTKKDQKLTPEQETQYQKIWEYLCKSQMAEGTTTRNNRNQTIKGVAPKDVVTWLKNRPFNEIVEAIRTTKDANVQTNYPGYVVSLFKKNVVAKKDNIQINNEYLKEVMKTHKCTHLQDTKQYVQDTIKHIDYQKNLDPKRFREMIESSIAFSKNYEPSQESTDSGENYEADYY